MSDEHEVRIEVIFAEGVGEKEEEEIMKNLQKKAEDSIKAFAPRKKKRSKKRK